MDDQLMTRLASLSEDLVAQMEEILSISSVAKELILELQRIGDQLPHHNLHNRPNLPHTTKVSHQLRHCYGLTYREIEVCLALFVKGSDKSVAEELSITPNTVKAHLRKLFSKLNVSSRHELILKVLTII